MRTKFGIRKFLQGIRDSFIGLALFLVLAAGLSDDPSRWDISSAIASDPISAQISGQALEMSAPALEQPGHPMPEHPMIAAMLQGQRGANAGQTGVAMTILALTFSLMFSFNLAIVRHLRRVYASPRRGS